MKTTFFAVVVVALLLLLGWVLWPSLSPYIDKAKTMEQVKVRKFNPF
jgi:hypothetical protein